MKRFITVLLMLFVLSVVSPVVLFAAGSTDGVEQAARVSLNAGSSSELQTLPGIGGVTAERIIVYRQQHGPFASIDALTNVKGVGVKTLAKIRPLVEL